MKKSNLIAFLSIMFIALLAACSTPKYFGKTYSPTKNVDVYMDKADVKKPFTTMGTTDVAEGFSSIEKAQQKVIEMGKANGADGVIMSLTDEVVSRQSVGTGIIPNTRGKTVVGTSISTSRDVKQKKINATFIKYDK